MKLEIQKIDGACTVRVNGVYFTLFPTHGGFWQLHSMTTLTGISLDWEQDIEWLREQLPEEAFTWMFEDMDINDCIANICQLDQ